jgi:hypothetical protein
METECHIIGIRKDILKRLGKQAGNLVNVRMHEDLLERRVDPHFTIPRIADPPGILLLSARIKEKYTNQ